eukprot:scaffold5562_cov156-Skeletonema_marinoi.AAC.2
MMILRHDDGRLQNDTHVVLSTRKPGGVIAVLWYYSFLRKPCHRRQGAEGYFCVVSCIYSA